MPYGGTIFSTVNADLVQTDVDGIVQGLTGPAGMTLSDVQDRLNLGLFDIGMMPYLQMLQMDLGFYLYNTNWMSEPWLQTVDRSINDGFHYHLYDQNTWQPWFQTVHNDLYSQMNMMPWLEMIRYDLQSYLYNWNWMNEPWLQTVDRSINDGFYYNLYDQNRWQPWFQTIHNDLYNQMSMMPWLETIRYDNEYYFHNINGPWGNEPWLKTVDRSITDGLHYHLYDQNTWQPWFQTVHNDLYSQMNMMPWLEMIRYDLQSYLYNWNWMNEPWLQTVDRSINDGFYYNLYDQNRWQPWFQTIHNDLYNQMSMMPWLETIRYDNEYYFHNINGPWGNEPWLKTVDRSITDGLHYHLYDQNALQPWLQTIHNDLYGQWNMMPWLEMIRYDLQSYLYNWNWMNEPWLQTVDRSINDGFYYHLYNQNSGQPWMQTIHNDLYSQMSLMPWMEMTNYDLRYYLYNQWSNQPWLESLTYAVDGGFYNMLYDQNAWQPWMQTINNNLNSYLYDWMNGRPLLESVRDELSAVRAVLEDVHDAAQHALRTV